MALSLQLPSDAGGLSPYALRGTSPARPPAGVKFNRIAYSAAHVVADPLASIDPWLQCAVDWDATIAYRRHLWSLGLGVAEAMDTAQRGMGLDWPVAKELIQRSLRHARTVGGDLACGAGTDHLPAGPGVTLDQVEKAYREQLEVIEAEGGRVILMASRALAQCAKGSDDYMTLYGRLLKDVSQPVVLHWLGDMFDPALRGYWGTSDIGQAVDTVARLIEDNVSKVEGIKISLLDAKWEIALRRRLPARVKMYTGDDFNYAELMAGDEAGFSHGLLGIFDPIAPVAAVALGELAAGNTERFRELLDPTVALSRTIFRTPTRHYKAGVVFLAWLNGHQNHFSMAAGLQSARGAAHYALVFELADACGVLADPELAVLRMKRYLSVACGCEG